MTDAHNTAPADPRVYIAQSLEGMKAATAAHCGSWHLDQAERWSVDMDEGLIRFVLPDGMHASAPVQIVGTTNSDDGSFLWGWDHPSVPPELAEHAELARAFGEAHGLPEYSNRKSNATTCGPGNSPPWPCAWAAPAAPIADRRRKPPACG